MGSEGYQVLVFGLMVLLCVSSYWRGHWRAMATRPTHKPDDSGWQDEAEWWRDRQLKHDQEYVSILRERKS